MEDLSNGVKGLAITDDLDKTEKERIDMLYEFVKRKRADGKLGVAGVDKEILNEAERLEVKDKGPLVLAELLLDNSILSQVSWWRCLNCGSRSLKGILVSDAQVYLSKSRS
jgi:translation initiation factor 5